MRKIKFRAWDKETKEMWSQILTDMGENEQYDDELSMWGIGHMMENGDNERFEFMEFTGLYDVKGTEVYEGDILKTKIPEGEIITQVVFHEYCWQEKLIKGPKNLLKDYFPFNWRTAHEKIEVIGNIYQNSY